MKKLIITIIVILILCNLFCYYMFFCNKSSHSTNIYADYLYYMREQSLLLENKYEGLNFPAYLKCGKDTSLIDISTIITSPTLVFYFSGQTCPPCLEAIKDSIKIIFPDYQNNANIIFMSNNLEKALYNNYLGKKIMRFQNKQDTLFSDGSIFPIFFILDTNLKIQHLFLIDKQTPKLTSYYLKIIKQRFFKPHQ